jgi:hypothetical protein
MEARLQDETDLHVEEPAGDQQPQVAYPWSQRLQLKGSSRTLENARTIRSKTLTFSLPTASILVVYLRSLMNQSRLYSFSLYYIRFCSLGVLYDFAPYTKNISWKKQ